VLSSQESLSILYKYEKINHALADAIKTRVGLYLEIKNSLQYFPFP